MYVTKFLASFFQVLGLSLIAISVTGAGAALYADWVPTDPDKSCRWIKDPGGPGGACNTNANCPATVPTCTFHSTPGGSVWCDCE